MQYFEIFGLLKVIRVSRLGRLINYSNVKDDAKMTLKLLKLIFFLLLFVHFVACGWYWLITQESVWVPPLDFMYVSTDLYEKDGWEQYWSMFYHAVLMFNGNELGPRTSMELAYVSIILITAAIVNANIFGNMAVIIASLNRKFSRFQEKIDTANTSMTNMKLPHELQRRVINYLRYTQSSLEYQKELQDFNDMISPSLMTEVRTYIFSLVIGANSRFKGSSKKFIDSVVSKIQTVSFKPEDEAVTQGDTAENMYFISSGECEVIVKDHNHSPHPERILTIGDYFGVSLLGIYETLLGSRYDC